MKAKTVHAGVEFLEIPQAWTILNSTPEWIEMVWDGETRRIPPRNETVQPHPKYADVCCSAKDEDGEFIPGTLIVRDIRQRGAMGAEHVIWSAAVAIKKVLGVDVKTGEYRGAYAMRGLSVLPEHPTRAMVEEVDADGLERWKAWKIKESLATVAKFEARNEALARAGMQPREGGTEYVQAKAIVDAAQADERNKALEMIRGTIGPKGFDEPLEHEEKVETASSEDLESLKSELESLKASMKELTQAKAKPRKKSSGAFNKTKAAEA